MDHECRTGRKTHRAPRTRYPRGVSHDSDSRVLWLAGLRPGHGHIATEVLIDRPAPQVFRWITTDDLLKKWIGGLTEVELMNPGPNGQPVGATFRLVEVLGQERTEMGMKVTRFDVNHDLEIRVWSTGDSKSGFTETAEYRLLEQYGKTHLRFAVQTDYYGWLPRLSEPLITVAARRKLNDDLSRLKMLVEAEPLGSNAALPTK